MARSTVVDLGELSQAVSDGVLRAVAANTQFKGFLAERGPGLIVRPIVTFGGMLYFGNAGRFAQALPSDVVGLDRG